MQGLSLPTNWHVPKYSSVQSYVSTQKLLSCKEWILTRSYPYLSRTQKSINKFSLHGFYSTYIRIHGFFYTHRVNFITAMKKKYVIFAIFSIGMCIFHMHIVYCCLYERNVASRFGPADGDQQYTHSPGFSQVGVRFPLTYNVDFSSPLGDLLINDFQCKIKLRNMMIKVYGTFFDDLLENPHVPPAFSGLRSMWCFY